jgi:Domain of unknown function (DUF4148)
LVLYRRPSITEIGIMKTLIGLSLAVSALLSPALSFAQNTAAPLTRAQVYADLVRVEQAGYNPSASDDSTYPADIQAAEAKVSAQNDSQTANASAESTSRTVETSAMGAPMAGSSASGMREPIKGKAGEAACVGPVSFCTPYFGG